MRETISIKLVKTLQKGKKNLSPEALCRIENFVLSQRMEDDSFMNKSGMSDIYYTLFGWMLSYVLGIRLNPEKMATYLAAQDMEQMDLIHYAACMRCRQICNLMKGGKTRFLLHSFSSVDIKQLDQFADVPHNDPQSPYSQYIWLSLLEDTGHTMKDKEAVLQSLSRYQMSGGGYSNLSNSDVASTNATVAALAVIGELDHYRMNAGVSYLHQLQEESGGFCAVHGSPLPDLLSTATSLFMLNCYGRTPAYSSGSFIEAHWLDTGGFSATILEESSDVEYTFYGLLALGTV